MFKKAGWSVVKPPTPLIPDGWYLHILKLIVTQSKGFYR